MPTPPVSAIILAGGAGRRMGGQDKGLIMLAGRPLVAHVVQRIAPQVAEILISANRNLSDYQALGYPVLCDASPDLQGPLAGLLSGLRAAQHEWLLSVPCDTPLLPVNLVTELLKPLLADEADITVAQAGDRRHHVVMLCRRDLAADLQTSLSAGVRAVHAWQAQHRTLAVTFPDAAAFANLNQPDDLARLR
ncbi:MAG TPA: molybdenum cofactor guanylyltransferase MobA [Betaproteobacteria bacterium]|nr:molybdenum cofactor guanylyltransferase MobA [Betaproteobacteria bacterium]